MDTSEEAVLARKEDLTGLVSTLTLDDSEKSPAERVNIFFKFVEVGDLSVQAKARLDLSSASFQSHCMKSYCSFVHALACTVEICSVIGYLCNSCQFLQLMYEFFLVDVTIV